MVNALFPDEVTLSIGAADAAVGACDTVSTLVTNFSQSGGEKDTESIPTFGGGNIDKESPRSQVEVSFDVVMAYSGTTGIVTTYWDGLVYGAGLTSATDGAAKVIYMEWTDGTNLYTRAYNNAKAVTWEPTSNAEDYLQGTMVLKLSPTTADATPLANVKIVAAAATTVSW